MVIIGWEIGIPVSYMDVDEADEEDKIDDYF